MAKMFRGLVVQDSRRFEIVVPRTFATVCFRPLLQGSVVLGEFLEEANELNRKLLESVNSSGKAYMTHAVVGGVYMIRFAVGATLTEENHVNAAWKVVQEHAAALLVGN